MTASTFYFIDSLLLSIIFSLLVVRHLDTRQRTTGKAYDRYDVILQLVAMFAPIATLLAFCVIAS